MLLFAKEIYLTSLYNKGFAIASQAGMYPVGTMKAQERPCPGALPESVTFFRLKGQICDLDVLN